MEMSGQLRPVDLQSMNSRWMRGWVRPEGSQDMMAPENKSLPTIDIELQ
jgi:hypothetical protein